MFDYSNFMPHGHCFLWKPEILWPIVGADITITTSYLSIPAALIYFAWKKTGMHDKSVLILFGTFILFCGATHAFSIYTIWVPDYISSAILKVLTASVSALTAFVVWKKMPLALKIPSPQELENKNLELQALNRELERRVEARVKESKRLARIVNQSTDAISSADANNEIISWNKSCERLFQYSVGEALGMPLKQLIDHSSLSEFEKIKNAIAKGNAYGPIETRGLRKDGTSVEISLSVFPLLDKSGNPIGSSSITRDISERKKLDDKLRQKSLEIEKKNKQLEELNKSKDEFLSNISHELKTPLGIISGFVDILDRCKDDETRVKMSIDGIRRNIMAQTYLVNDLIDISRFGSKKFSLNVDSSNIYDILQAALESVDFSARRKNISVNLDISIKEKVISCDQRRLKQILWNLLSNSVKFTPSGGKIDLKVTQSNDSFVFEVIDSGKGLDSDEVKNVFNRLWQSKSNSENERIGMGLGLTITQDLVNSHGGKIEVSSPGPGKGTRFRFNIPQKASLQISSTGESPNEHAETLSGLNVLIVEDNPEANTLLEILFKSAGADVSTARDGLEAILRIKRSQFDCIVSDINMSGMNGLEFIKACRQLEKASQSPHVPAIAITAHKHQDSASVALLAGFDKFLEKPLKSEDLIRNVQSLVGSSAG